MQVNIARRFELDPVSKGGCQGWRPLGEVIRRAVARAEDACLEPALRANGIISLATYLATSIYSPEGVAWASRLRVGPCS